MSEKNEWKWNQVSNNAMKVVGSFFSITPETLKNAKDKDVSKALKNADASDVQVKRVQDLVNATKKQWRNQSKIGAMIHGLVRTGFSHILTQRRQESTTSKEYAKLVTNTSVLSTQTRTAVEKTYSKGAKQMTKAENDLQRFKGDLNEQYQVIEENANAQANTRRIGYRANAQKRLESGKRPWRNY